MAFCEAMKNAPVRGSSVHPILESLYLRNKKLNQRGQGGG